MPVWNDDVGGCKLESFDRPMGDGVWGVLREFSASTLLCSTPPRSAPSLPVFLRYAGLGGMPAPTGRPGMGSGIDGSGIPLHICAALRDVDMRAILVCTQAWGKLLKKGKKKARLRSALTATRRSCPVSSSRWAGSRGRRGDRPLPRGLPPLRLFFISHHSEGFISFLHPEAPRRQTP